MSKRKSKFSATHKVRGVLMTRTQVANMLGVAFTTIQRWDSKGLRTCVPGDPGRSQPTLYDSAEAIEYFVNRELSRVLSRDPAHGTRSRDDDSLEFLNRDQELARLYRAQRIKLSAENEARRDRLLDADEVAAAQAYLNAHIRARFAAIVPKAAPLVAAENNRARCAKIIEGEVYAALTELSETKLVPVDDKGYPAK